MKKILFISMLTMLSLNSFSQTKKEVIEQQKQTIDSLKTIIKIYNLGYQKNKTIADSLNDIIEAKKTEVTRLNIKLSKTNVLWDSITQRNKILQEEIISLNKKINIFTPEGLEVTQIIAKFTYEGWGDCHHLIFVDEKGKEYDFGWTENHIPDDLTDPHGDLWLDEKLLGKKFALYITDWYAPICSDMATQEAYGLSQFEFTPTIVDIKLISK